MSLAMCAVVVDDDPASSNTVVQHLRAAGYHPLIPARATVDAILDLQPSVILLRLAPGATPGELFTLSDALSRKLPHVPIVLYATAVSAATLQLAMAAGITRFMPEPLRHADLVKTLSEARAQLQVRAQTIPPASAPAGTPKLPPAPGSIIACFGSKGGVGTTTVAVNLAVCLRQAGHRVALVDASVNRGNVGLFLNLSSQRSILDLVGESASTLVSRTRAMMVTHKSGVDVLLAPLAAEQGDRVGANDLRGILTALQPSYDAVVVDTSSIFDDRTLLILEMADRVVTPMEPCIASVKGLAEFMRISLLLGHNPDRLMPVVMRATSVHPNQIKSIETYLRMPLRHRVVSDGPRVVAAQNEGVPLVVRDRNSQVAVDLRSLAMAALPQAKPVPHPDEVIQPAKAATMPVNTGILGPLREQVPDKPLPQTRFLAPPMVRRLAASVSSAMAALPHRTARI